MACSRPGRLSAPLVLFVLILPALLPVPAASVLATTAAATGSGAGSVADSVTEGDPNGRPDIVLINTDDQRFDSLAGCLAPGAFGRPAPLDALPAEARCPMPNLKQHLADQGVTFLESFATTALCCPSRASLLTGRYAHVTGVLTNEKPHGGISEFRSLEGSTIATWLDGAGYRTSLVGKYVNQYKCKSPPCSPPPGWDDWHAELTDGDGNYSNFELNDNGAVTAYPGYYAPILGQKAVDFIASTPSTSPLFLYFAPFGPHPKAEPATGDGAAYDAMPNWRPPSFDTAPSDPPAWVLTNPAPRYIHKDAEHRNEIEALIDIDRQIGAIVQALGPRAGNTLFMFTSDNGISWGEHEYFDKKNCEYEECHRVPMVVRYDPLTSGISRVDVTHPVQNIDLAPTLLDATGTMTGGPADGRSLLPLLTPATSDDPADWPTSLLGEDYGSLISCNDCVRVPTLAFARTFAQDPLGAWKYVELDTGERELYDQAADPYELTNQASNPDAATTRDAMEALLGSLQGSQPPVVTFAGGPPAATNQTSASIPFTATGASRMWCSLDGAARAPCQSPFETAGPLSDGQHSLRVVAEGTDLPNGRQGTSAPVSLTWTVDTDPPTTTITGGPSGTVGTSSASFSFVTDEPGGGFECSLDGAGFASCGSPHPVSVGEGPHTFSVRAVDAAGNPDPAPPSRTWTVDLTSPETTVTGGPPALANSRGPYDVHFEASEPATFECRVNSQPWFTCTSPGSVTVSADGAHSFHVKATDAVGRVDATPATHSWTVDTQPPPVPTFTEAPPAQTGSTSATFAFSDTEGGVTFTCSLDDGPPEGCSSPVTHDGLAQGPHTFSVRAVDAAGNASANRTHTWTIDGSPVDTAITAGPAEGSSTRSTSAAFQFQSSPGGLPFECSLDAAAYVGCSSPRTVGVGEGPHTFAVRAVTGGVPDPTPATRSWTVDLTDPDTTITGGPSGSSNQTQPSFAFASNETGATFRCRLDGSAWQECATPRTVGQLSAGSHTFQVRAHDAAGNRDGSPASRTWTVDLTAPDTTITSGPAEGSSTPGDVTFQFTSNESGSTFACSLDGADPAPCSSPALLSGLTPGPHVFGVRATDPAGNPDPSAASRSWTVESSSSSAPDTSITSGPAEDSASSSADATFTFSSTPGGAGFECSLDGAPFAPCASGGQGGSFAGLPDGVHSFAVRAVAAGVRDPTPAQRSWTVDTQAPTTAFSDPDADQLLSSSALTLKWTGADPAPSSGSVTYEIEERAGLGGSWSGVATQSTKTLDRGALAPGTWCWRVTATDPAGNALTTPGRCVAVPMDDRTLAVNGPAGLLDDPGAYQGTLTVLNAAGGQVSATVTGRKVGLLFQRGPAMGKAQVLVDQVVVKTVDLYRSTVQQKFYGWTTTFPGVETHVVRVMWTGTRNAQSSGTDVPVDGLAVVGGPPGAGSSSQQR